VREDLHCESGKKLAKDKREPPLIDPVDRAKETDQKKKIIEKLLTY